MVAQMKMVSAVALAIGLLAGRARVTASPLSVTTDPFHSL